MIGIQLIMKLIKFYTQTCGPCKVMKPIVDKLVQNHPELEYQEVDCTEGVPNEWVQTVRNVPTIIIIKDNAPNEKAVGIKTYVYIKRHL